MVAFCVSDIKYSSSVAMSCHGFAINIATMSCELADCKPNCVQKNTIYIYNTQPVDENKRRKLHLRFLS